MILFLLACHEPEPTSETTPYLVPDEQGTDDTPAFEADTIERSIDEAITVFQSLDPSPIIAAYDRVSQAFGERYCDLVAQWGHKMNPIRAQPWAQDRNRYDPAAWEPEFCRHQSNDVAVAQHVRAADVKNATRRFRCRQHANQIREHVLDCDWLAWCVHPLWSNHDRQAVDEISQDLEGRRA